MNRERELKKLNDRQSYLIRVYCDAVGCKDCPENRKSDDCESVELVGKTLDLELMD